MKALVSIHDVMPDTMGNVAELIALCAQHGVAPLTLLVVPGLAWKPDQVDQIRRWEQEGHVLAAHGWHHRAASISTLYHRLHSLILSRDVAEHLSLDEAQVSQLMDRSGQWFEDNGFAIPELYVPPAWALGKISAARLRDSPFRMVETLGGVMFPHPGIRVRTPVIGFEADTAFRQASLRTLNQIAIASARSRPLRVSIHPNDHRLRLNSDLTRVLDGCTEQLAYADLLACSQITSQPQ